MVECGDSIPIIIRIIGEEKKSVGVKNIEKILKKKKKKFNQIIQSTVKVYQNSS